MKKIKDLVVGSTASIVLIVRSSEIKMTKPPGNKPYLWMELFDGQDNIVANNWDQPDNPPTKNTVLTITASVAEWAGNKQLKVIRQDINFEVGVEAFAPNGDVDVAWYVQKAKDLIDEIRNKDCRDIVLNAFYDHPVLWKTVPAAKSNHHAFVAGNLKHSVDVALKAKALGEIDNANLDLCIAGGLLQDFGKLWTYELNGASIDMTHAGMLFEHIAVGMMKLEIYRTEENSKVLDLIQHMVASHHGRLEYGSPMTPKFLEAVIVSAADAQDAKAQALKEANLKAKPDDVLTAKIWPMDNREMFTQSYIEGIMA